MLPVTLKLVLTIACLVTVCLTAEDITRQCDAEDVGFPGAPPGPQSPSELPVGPQGSPGPSSTPQGPTEIPGAPA